MTSIAMSAPAEAYSSTTTSAAPSTPAAGGDLSPARAQRLARMTGVLFILTYLTSIPPVVAFYVPALSDPAFILGGGTDGGLGWGAILELALIVANIGTALALFPILRRQSEVLAIGFITARLVESVFIAVGIVSLLALGTLRLEAAGADHATLLVTGQALVALHDWTFLLGPGFVVGIGNGLLLGYMMFRSRLVPRALSVLGLIGGPALMAATTAVLLGIVEQGSAWQMAPVLPEFLWELLFGIWLIARGFNPAALATLLAGRAR
jgi:hypothetical protein